MVCLAISGFSANACEPPPDITIDVGQGMDSYNITDIETPAILPSVNAGEGPKGVAESGKMVKGPKLFSVKVKEKGVNIEKTVYVIPNPSRTISMGDGYYMVCMRNGVLFVKDLGLPFTKRVRREGIFIPGAKPEKGLRRALKAAAAKYEPIELVFEVHEAKQPQVVQKTAVIPGTLTGNSGAIGGGLGKWTASETNGREYTVYPYEVLAKVNYEPGRPAEREEDEEAPKPPEIPDPSAEGVINTPFVDARNVMERIKRGDDYMRKYFSTGDITPLNDAKDEYKQAAVDVDPKNKKAWRRLAYSFHLISQHPVTEPKFRKVYMERARRCATWKDRGGWTKSLEELWAKIETDLGVETKPAPPLEKEREKPKARVDRTKRAITVLEKMRGW
jgi:hypothetical protein